MKQFTRVGSIILKSAIILLILLGTIFTFVFFEHRGEVFCYYTAQCNMLAMLVMAVLLVFDIFGGIRKEQYYYMIKFFITMCGLLSLLVYTGLFTPTEQMKMGGGWYGVICHAVVPLLLLADYMIFDRKGHIPWYTPLLCGAGPLLHGLFIVFRSLTGEGYHIQDSPTIVSAPYAFLRGDAVSTAVSVIGLLVGFILLCYLIYLIDMGYAAVRDKLKPLFNKKDED
jgi:hypothetical protein